MGFFDRPLSFAVPFLGLLAFTILQYHRVNGISAIDTFPGPALLRGAIDLLMNHYAAATRAFHIRFIECVVLNGLHQG
jgi:hypothetical protein